MNLPDEDVEVNIFAPVNEHIFVPIKVWFKVISLVKIGNSVCNDDLVHVHVLMLWSVEQIQIPLVKLVWYCIIIFFYLKFSNYM